MWLKTLKARANMVKVQAGKYLAGSTGDGTMRIWDTSTDQCLAVVQCDSESNSEWLTEMLADNLRSYITEVLGEPCPPETIRVVN